MRMKLINVPRCYNPVRISKEIVSFVKMHALCRKFSKEERHDFIKFPNR